MYSFAITFFERVNFKYIIMDKKRVYTFGNGQAEGKADMRNLLGGKGATLAEMNLSVFPYLRDLQSPQKFVANIMS